MHTVTVAAANDTTQRTVWTCTCGATREASDIGQAGAEALSHLRNAEEGLL